MLGKHNVALDESFLNTTFPFFFIVDSNLQVLYTGKSLNKLDPNFIGHALIERVKFKRPQYVELNFEFLKKIQNQIVLLELTNTKSPLIYKGQIIHIPLDNQLLFLGSVWITDLQELQNNGLNISDYSLSDSTVDMLQMMQLQKLVSEDIKVLNENLRVSEEKYRTLIEGASDIIYQTDHKGYFTYMNEVGLKILKTTKDKIIGEHFTRMIAPSHKTVIFDKCLHMYENLVESDYMEFPIQDNNKEAKMWIGQNVSAVFEKGRITGFQSVARDITQRITFENELVKEKEKAQQAAKAKAQFLANMSHEIRTPLNGIYGLTNLLLKTDLTEKQKKYLDSIAISSETLMAVVNDILEISKIEVGKLRIHQQTFSLKQVLSQVFDLLSIKATEKGLLLNANFDDNLPEFITGDPVRLNQILYNLIGNAVKFTTEGHVNFIAKKELKNNSQEILKIYIEDTGIGIPQDKVDVIFKAFSQVDDNFNRKFGGTGLGLTITKKLIELQDGEIFVTSTEGKGSTFSFYLPLVKAEQKALLPEINNEFEKLSLKNLKILLVEDNTVNQLVTSDLLTGEGVEVKIANHGLEAINFISNENFDLVLMDMQMPIMDGYTAMKTIREDATLLDLPIIALTAHVTENEIEKCKKFGANDYISKPFLPKNLFDKIKKLIFPEAFEKGGEHKADFPQNEKVQENIPILDLSILKNFTNNNENIIQKTLASLREELPKEVQKMEETFNAKEYQTLGKILHKSKPNFLMISRKELNENLIQLEALCLENTSEYLIAEKYKIFKNFCEQLLTELKVTNI